MPAVTHHLNKTIRHCACSTICTNKYTCLQPTQSLWRRHNGTQTFRCTADEMQYTCTNLLGIGHYTNCLVRRSAITPFSQDTVSSTLVHAISIVAIEYPSNNQGACSACYFAPRANVPNLAFSNSFKACCKTATLLITQQRISFTSPQRQPLLHSLTLPSSLVKYFTKKTSEPLSRQDNTQCEYTL